MLAMEGSDTHETPDLVEGTARSRRRGGALEPARRSVSVLDAAMILPLTTSAITSLGYYVRFSRPALRSLNCLPQVWQRNRRYPRAVRSGRSVAARDVYCDP